MSLRTAVRRPAALLLQAAVLTALLGGTAGWAATAKTVTISVDGELRTVRTHGTAVRDVLAAAGLAPGKHDLLVPAAEQKVLDGDRVALRRARQLALVVDGKSRNVWVTAASVEEALNQIGIRTAGAVLSASRSREIPLDGLAVDVRLPKAVAVVADGKVAVLSTTGRIVLDALKEAGVVLTPQDKLSSPRNTPLSELMTIRVTRITAKRIVESVPIAFDTVRQPDPELFRGEAKVLQAGRPGVLMRTYALNYVDRKLKSKLMTSEKLTATPVTRILAVGTKARPAARTSSSTGTSADNLNWAALARCESGGNPRAVSSTGRYRGLYQFSIATWRSVGGVGDPIDASPAEQTYRAKILVTRSGRGQWPVCGKYL